MRFKRKEKLESVHVQKITKILHTTVWSRKVKHTVVGNLEPQSLLAGLEVAVQSFAICAMCASVPGSLGRTEESEGQIGFY